MSAHLLLQAVASKPPRKSEPPSEDILGGIVSTLAHPKKMVRRFGGRIGHKILPVELDGAFAVEMLDRREEVLTRTRAHQSLSPSVRGISAGSLLNFPARRSNVEAGRRTAWP